MKDQPARGESPHAAPANPATQRVLVWDLPVRVFHWALVVCVAGSWLTHEIGDSAFRWHVYFGYTTLVLVFFRIVWGFVGPRHARFTSFVRGAGTAITYARTAFGPRAQRHAGHNPLGALMVVLFLLLLGTQGVTGLFANDEIMNTGPLYGYVTDETSDVLSRIHHQLSEILWIAIGVHVVAIALYWLLRHENLVGPMFTGRKQAADVAASEGIASSRVLLALLIAAIGAGLLWWVVASAPEPSLLLF